MEDGRAVPDASNTTTEVSEATSQKEQRKIKILLIEDDFFLSDIYQTKLSLEDFEVVVAEDGVEGLHQASVFLPDLILLDIMIPKMDGLEVLKKIKMDYRLKNTPVILLSNLGQDNITQGGRDLGATDYLLKSDYTPRQVIQKIHYYLESAA